jgi:hypothetical protein
VSTVSPPAPPSGGTSKQARSPSHSGTLTTTAPSLAKPPCTREQSLLRIYARNQSVDDTFEAWHAPSGMWGGRVGVSSSNPAAQQDTTVLERDAKASGTGVQDWATRAINAPFFEPPPSQVLSSIYSQLVMNNDDHSRKYKRSMPGWTELVQSTPVPVATPLEVEEDTSPLWAV